MSSVSAELSQAPHYGVLEFVRRYRKVLPGVVGMAAFAAVGSAGSMRQPSGLFRALLVGAAASGATAFVVELTDLVTDTLLPE